MSETIKVGVNSSSIQKAEAAFKQFGFQVEAVGSVSSEEGTIIFLFKLTGESEKIEDFYKSQLAWKHKYSKTEGKELEKKTVH